MDTNERDKSAEQRILDTTFRLLSERGYARLSMRDIASGAGVAVSQIAYYYKNKAGLFSAVAERMIRMIQDEVRPYLASARESREWMRGLIGFTRDFVLTHPDHLRVMLDLAAQSQWEPEFRARIAQLVATFDADASRLTGGEAQTKCMQATCVAGLLLGASLQMAMGDPTAADGLSYGESILLGDQK